LTSSENSSYKYKNILVLILSYQSTKPIANNGMRRTNLTGSLPHWVREWGVGDFEVRVNLKGWASREARELLGRENMCWAVLQIR